MKLIIKYKFAFLSFFMIMFTICGIYFLAYENEWRVSAESIVEEVSDKSTITEIVFPTASAIYYGQALNKSELQGGSELGQFSWADPSQVPKLTDSSFAVTFTPSEENLAVYDFSKVEGYDEETCTITQPVEIKINTLKLTMKTDKVTVYEHGTTSIIQDDGILRYGMTIKFCYEDKPGYKIVVMANDVKKSNNSEMTVYENIIVNYEESQIKYCVNLEIIGEGTATILGLNEGQAYYNDTITIELSYQNGYAYQITCDTQTPVTFDELSFIMPNYDVYLTITFYLIDYQISVIYNDGGQVDYPSTSNYGESVTISIIPNEGFEYSIISQDVHIDDNGQFLMPNSDVEIQIVFTKISYNIVLEVGEGGTILVDKDSATYGEVVTLTITSEIGYQLTSIEGVTIDENDSFIMPASDVSICASFDKISYNINIIVAGNGTASLSVKTATIGEKVILACEGETGYEATIEANVDVEEDGSFIMPPENVEIHVDFIKTQYIIIILQSEKGTIFSDKQSTTYGEVVTLTITPEIGYQLTSIEGVTIDENGSFIMPASNVSISAMFDAIIYNIHIIAPDYGTLNTQGTRATYGQIISFQVLPVEGYRLKEITGVEVEGNSFVMPACDVYISALFIPVEVILYSQDQTIDIIADTQYLNTIDGYVKIDTVNSDTINKLENEYRNVEAYDITLLDNESQEIELTGSVLVQIKLSETFKNINNLKILRIEETEGELEQFEYAYDIIVKEIDGERINFLQFETDHFSIYAIVESEEPNNVVVILSIILSILILITLLVVFNPKVRSFIINEKNQHN